jgi:hypothetical protein
VTGPESEEPNLTRPTRITLLIVSLLSCAATACAASGEPPERVSPSSGEAPQALTKGQDFWCGSTGPGPLDPLPPANEIREWTAQGRMAAGARIPVAFHVITDNKGVGDVPEWQLDAQIEVLNRAYAGLDYDGNPVPGAANTGYTFYKASVDRTRSNPWFTMLPSSNHEYKAKLRLGVNPETTLNIYTCAPGNGFLGWANAPWWLAVVPVWDGPVIHYGTLPGGSVVNHNHGGIAVHEVGHWLGLLHTFQDGCTDETVPGCYLSGDGVCDTPSEAIQTVGCPDSKDTCPTGGPDPIHNYMDYTFDQCLNQFTPGQADRMHFMVATYRPLIEGAGAALAASRWEADRSSSGAASLLDARPNPFNPRTRIEFDVPREGRVTLRIHDIRGRLAATVLDRLLPSGHHSVDFDGLGLASGVYLLRMNLPGGRSVVRRITLLK